ncbi:aminoglycoside phosphotransferase family protein [Halobacillus amylolyticus]|uniref:Aminoglycoside phosphotransferase family protein n=1 Tax=Halobacillus amylolyticus TaxID=2932259 RepID=A0ABY4HBD3_9BACI|nr:aminoglycoside phosphotransferase family protein [Halobacillus amylolyticus]UOR12174.1 aminoglycoside phosphotransferase family protein [Halobacillus amylolyticus]
MTSKERKGDSYTDRLFHWLNSKEKLRISHDLTIKPKVYKAYYHNKPVLLKGYRRSRVLTQQVEFFNHWYEAGSIAAVPLAFPDGSFTKSKLGCEWGIFNWIEGRHADFKVREDRIKTYAVLRQFHRSTRGISMLSIPKDPLYIKWAERIKQFEDTEQVFHSYRKKRLYDEIHTTMEKQLSRFTDNPWGEIEQSAWEQHEWLHGDVAHHNFIIDRNQKAKIIDFDLLYTGPKLYDDIQIAQRFLPHLEGYKSEFFSLFNRVKQPRLWLQGVLVPADLLREWLYAYRRCLREEASLSLLLSKLERAWGTRKRFVRYTEYMLK